jgi:hypothetical protein
MATSSGEVAQALQAIMDAGHLLRELRLHATGNAYVALTEVYVLHQEAERLLYIRKRRSELQQVKRRVQVPEGAPRGPIW